MAVVPRAIVLSTAVKTMRSFLWCLMATTVLPVAGADWNAITFVELESSDYTES
jgi:hypothetical protein